jgi:hypothetical protein
MKPLFLLVLMLSISGGVMSMDAEMKVGDEVLAYWEKGDAYFIGTLVEADNTVKGGGFLVIFADGDSAVVPYARIKPLKITTDMKVIARFTDGQYYPGVISKIVGRAYYIHFDDGDKAWTSAAGIAVK